MICSRLAVRKVDRRGAMLVLIAFCLPLCIIMAAFAVDVAWMQLTRTELRTSTDAAARAAQGVEPGPGHDRGQECRQDGRCKKPRGRRSPVA